MAEGDFTMTVGEFVQLAETNGEVCVINTAQITIIQKQEESWRVRLVDGVHVEISEHVARAFMNRLAGMPLAEDDGSPRELPH